MPTTFHMATEEERKFIDYAMRQWHKKLAEAGVRIGVLFAHNAEGHAVTHGGYPAAATIKVLSLKERVAKSYDAEMLIDEDGWDLKTAEEKAALCDHELSHLQVVERKKSPGLFDESDGPWWKTDDIGRPKLKTRKGDFNVGDGFAQVIARHGLNAIEYANIKAAKTFADKAAAEGDQVEVEETA